LLQRALRSALSQQDVEVEAIVVDDGSSRRPPAEVRSLLQEGVFVRQKERRGVSSARNAGIARASSEWVGFLDDDDLWAPARLTTLLNEARNRNADFAYSSAILVDDDLRPFKLQVAPDPSLLPQRLLQRNEIPGGGSAVLARTRVVRECGGFDEGLSYLADWDLWLRLVEAGTAAAVAQPLLAHCRHAGAWGRSPDPQTRRHDIDLFARKHAELASRHGVAVDRTDRFLAHSLWRSGHRRAASRAYLQTALRDRDPGALARAAGAFFPVSALARLQALRVRDPEWLAAYRDPGSAG
jgi:glycosyltransferase involved in cell wall biosynthesis